MQSEEIDALVSERVRVLSVICSALVLSVGIYVVIAWFLVQQQKVIVEAVSPILLWVLSGAAAALLLAAPAVVGLLRSRAVGAGADDVQQRLNGSHTAVIVGFALREGAAVIGLVLTLLSGELMWVVVLAAATAASMMLAWPKRETLAEVIRGGPAQIG